MRGIGKDAVVPILFGISSDNNLITPPLQGHHYSMTMMDQHSNAHHGFNKDASSWHCCPYVRRRFQHEVSFRTKKLNRPFLPENLMALRHAYYLPSSPPSDYY